MPLARYYRLIGFATDGNTALELSEARLCAGGVTVDSGAVISTTLAPSTGSVSYLSDDSASAVVTWLYPQYLQPGFAIHWDFGSAVESDALRILLGSGSVAKNFPYAFTLQRSVDLVSWVTQGEVTAAQYPGDSSLSSVTDLLDNYPTTVLADTPIRYFRMREASGAAAIDERGNGNGTYSGTYALGASGFTPDGKALSVSGQGALDCGFNTNLTSAFTLEFLFSAAASGHGDNPTLVGKKEYYASGTTEFPIGVIWHPVVHKVLFQMSKGDSYSNAMSLASSTLSVVVPYLVHIIYRASGLCELYIDGVLHDSTTIDFTVGSTSLNWTAARAYETSGGVGQSGFAGTMAELAIYNYALSSARVAAHFASKSSPGGIYPGQARAPRVHRVSAAEQLFQPAEPLDASTAHGHVLDGKFFDAQYGGNGVISGTVAGTHSPANHPLQRRVLLLDERSQQAVSETWSDIATGAYEFVGIRDDLAYTVITYDHLHNYRAVVADNLTLANGGVELL